MGLSRLTQHNDAKTTKVYLYSSVYSPFFFLSFLNVSILFSSACSVCLCPALCLLLFLSLSFSPPLCALIKTARTAKRHNTMPLFRDRLYRSPLLHRLNGESFFSVSRGSCVYYGNTAVGRLQRRCLTAAAVTPSPSPPPATTAATAATTVSTSAELRRTQRESVRAASAHGDDEGRSDWFYVAAAALGLVLLGGPAYTAYLVRYDTETRQLAEERYPGAIAWLQRYVDLYADEDTDYRFIESCNAGAKNPGGSYRMVHCATPNSTQLETCRCGWT